MSLAGLRNLMNNPVVIQETVKMNTAMYQGCAGKVLGTIEEQRKKLVELEATGRYVCEPKCDGIWAEIRFTGDRVMILSRNSKEKEYTEFQAFKDACPKGTILAGELAYGSQESRIYREKFGHGFIDLFDILAYGDTMFVNHPGLNPSEYKVQILNDKDRRAMLEKVVRENTAPKFQEFFRTVLCTPVGFVEMFDKEHEGVILKHRNNDYTYVGGKVNHWIKVKKQPTWDMIVVGWTKSDADTKINKNMAKDVELAMYFEVSKTEYDMNKSETVKGLVPKFEKDGKFYVTHYCGRVGAMTHEWCSEFAQNFDNWYGKVFEIAGYKQFTSGAIRHPSLVRYRDDKNPMDCIYTPEVEEE